MESVQEMYKSVLNSISAIKDQLKSFKKSEGGEKMAEVNKKEAAKAAKEKAEADIAVAKKMLSDAEAAKKQAETDEGEASEVVAVAAKVDPGVKTEVVVPEMAKADEAGAPGVDKGVIVEVVVPATVGQEEEKKEGFRETKSSKKDPDNDGDDDSPNSKNNPDKKEDEKQKASMATYKPAADDPTYASLDSTKKALADKYSYAELLDTVASLTSQIASFEKEKDKAKASKLADERFVELQNLGIASTGEKVVSQKMRISTMPDVAFATYKEELLEIKDSADVKAGKETLEKAKADAGNLSVEVTLDNVDLIKKYSAIK